MQFERVLANPREPQIRYTTTWGGGPAITGSIAVLSTAGERQPPSFVHKRSQNQRRPAVAGGRSGLVRRTLLSSGDRIRTCDLWVMSQPVPVSRLSAGLKSAGHDRSPV